MDFVQILAGAIVLGSTLGATVAGFFAYRQKSLVSLLRESNNDYKDRNVQLESERDELREVIIKLKDSVHKLENERRLPLEKLTKLIVTQHAENQESILQLTKAISKNNTVGRK